jgi:hypothetical protein
MFLGICKVSSPPIKLGPQSQKILHPQIANLQSGTFAEDSQV